MDDFERSRMWPWMIIHGHIGKWVKIIHSGFLDLFPDVAVDDFIHGHIGIGVFHIIRVL